MGMNQNGNDIVNKNIYDSYKQCFEISQRVKTKKTHIEVKQTDRQKERKKDRQTDRQTDNGGGGKQLMNSPLNV